MGSRIQSAATFCCFDPSSGVQGVRSSVALLCGNNLIRPVDPYISKSAWRNEKLLLAALRCVLLREHHGIHHNLSDRKWHGRFPLSGATCSASKQYSMEQATSDLSGKSSARPALRAGLWGWWSVIPDAIILILERVSQVENAERGPTWFFNLMFYPCLCFRIVSV